jgi:hypothetical protein
MTMNAATMNGTIQGTTEMYTVTEVITPEVARWYLQQHNRGNRPILWSVVDAIAWDIATGKFVVTGQGIEFDKDMNLVDGQHRLHAIVKADRAQTMRITFNAPGIDAPRDRGRIRAVGDFLLDGSGARVAQPTRVAAICTAIELLVTQEDVRPTVDRIRDRLAEHRMGIEWVLDAVPARQPAFVQASFAYAYPCNTHGVAEFVASYLSLAHLEPGSPALLLHRAVREMPHQRAAQKFDGMLRTLRCLHLHFQGRLVQRVMNIEEGFDHFRGLHEVIRLSRAAT